VHSFGEMKGYHQEQNALTVRIGVYGPVVTAPSLNSGGRYAERASRLHRLTCGDSTVVLGDLPFNWICCSLNSTCN